MAKPRRKSRPLGETNKEKNAAIKMVVADAIEQGARPMQVAELERQLVSYRMLKTTKRFDIDGRIKTYPNDGKFSRECPIRRGNSNLCTLMNIHENADGGVLATVRIEDDEGGRNNGMWLLHSASKADFCERIPQHADPAGRKFNEIRAFCTGMPKRPRRTVSSKTWL